MKTISIIASVILLHLPFDTNAQNFHIFGDKAYGGTNGDGATNILNYGNDMVVIGTSNSNISGNKTVPICYPGLSNQKDIWIIRIDTSFNIIWQNDIGGDKLDRYPYIIKSQISSKLYFSCNSESDSSCSKSENNRSYPNSFDDYWIGALDSNGVLLWEKTLGGNGVEDEPKIFELSNGELIVNGSSISPPSGDKSVTNFGARDWWLIKTDSLGNKIWDKVYGGLYNDFSIQSLSFIEPLNNGDFILGGTTESPASGTITDTSRGLYDIWIARIDIDGNQLWDKRFGGSSSDYFKQIKKTNDNGFVICGTTRSPQSGDVSDTSRGLSDIWVLKLDSLGNKIWDKRFGGNNYDVGVCVLQDFDGGYLIGGYTQSPMGLDISEPPYGSDDYWVIKIDSLGNKIWDKRFGGTGINYLGGMILLPDSSIVMSGSSDSSTSAVKTDPGYGSSDFWLIRFKYGNFPTGISSASSSHQSISVHPNPTQNWITIDSDASISVREFILYDLSGRKILERKILDSNKIDISNIPTALYFYQIVDNMHRVYFGKLVKQ